LLLWIWGYPKSKGYLPPGLRPLPFLGNILQIDPKSFLKSFEMVSWAEVKRKRQQVEGKEAELTGSKAGMVYHDLDFPDQVGNSLLPVIIWPMGPLEKLLEIP
jgi:hypothetical protein